MRGSTVKKIAILLGLLVIMNPLTSIGMGWVRSEALRILELAVSRL